MPVTRKARSERERVGLAISTAAGIAKRAHTSPTHSQLRVTRSWRALDRRRPLRDAALAALVSTNVRAEPFSCVTCGPVPRSCGHIRKSTVTVTTNASSRASG